MIDGQNFFDQPENIKYITYNSIQKIATGQRDDYITGCLMDYNCFKNYYQVIAIDFSKQQALDIDPKAMQHINLNRNLAQEATIFFIVEEAKETILAFSQEL